MIRWIARLIGIGFVGVLLIALYGTVREYISSPPEATAEHEFHKEPKELDLESNAHSASSIAPSSSAGCRSTPRSVRPVTG